MLKVVQSPQSEVECPSQKFFFLIFDLKVVSCGTFWVVFYVIQSYKRVNKRPGIDPANQRVPGLRPERPGTTLSPVEN